MDLFTSSGSTDCNPGTLATSSTFLVDSAAFFLRDMSVFDALQSFCLIACRIFFFCSDGKTSRTASACSTIECTSQTYYLGGRIMRNNIDNVDLDLKSSYQCEWETFNSRCSKYISFNSWAPKVVYVNWTKWKFSVVAALLPRRNEHRHWQSGLLQVSFMFSLGVCVMSALIWTWPIRPL